MLWVIGLFSCQSFLQCSEPHARTSKFWKICQHKGKNISTGTPFAPASIRSLLPVS
jgi:hypothetical protein